MRASKVSSCHLMTRRLRMLLNLLRCEILRQSVSISYCSFVSVTGVCLYTDMLRLVVIVRLTYILWMAVLYALPQWCFLS